MVIRGLSWPGGRTPPAVLPTTVLDGYSPGKSADQIWQKQLDVLSLTGLKERLIATMCDPLIPARMTVSFYMGVLRRVWDNGNVSNKNREYNTLEILSLSATLKSLQ